MWTKPITMQSMLATSNSPWAFSPSWEFQFLSWKEWLVHPLPTMNCHCSHVSSVGIEMTQIKNWFDFFLNAANIWYNWQWTAHKTETSCGGSMDNENNMALWHTPIIHMKLIDSQMGRKSYSTERAKSGWKMWSNDSHHDKGRRHWYHDYTLQQRVSSGRGCLPWQEPQSSQLKQQHPFPRWQQMKLLMWKTPWR